MYLLMHSVASDFVTTRFLKHQYLAEEDGSRMEI